MKQNDIAKDEIVLIGNSGEVRNRWYIIAIGEIIFLLFLLFIFLNEANKFSLIAYIEIISIIFLLFLVIIFIIGSQNIRDILILPHGLYIPYRMKPKTFPPIIKKNDHLIFWSEIKEIQRNQYGLIIITTNRVQYLIHPLTDSYDQIEEIIKKKINT